MEENEQEDINKETSDNFMLVTTQAIAFLHGFHEYLDEEYNKIFVLNFVSQIWNLVKQVSVRNKIINLCNLQSFHLKEIAKLHQEFAESLKGLK